MKVYRWIQNYLVLAFPFVIAMMAWGSFQSQAEIAGSQNPLLIGLSEILSWNLMLWFFTLICFFFLLVVKSDAREFTLRRIALLKERDEREEYITGKASRVATISSLSLLCLLLFLSVFTLQIYRAPPEAAIQGKTGTVSIGMRFKLFDAAKAEVAPEGKILFESSDLPLSKSAILLLVLCWQMGAFALTARKELRG